MRVASAAVLMLVALGGCAGRLNWNAPPADPGTVGLPNPLLIPIANHEVVWEGVVSVVGEYFRIDREEPVRLLGNTITEGRLETFPKNGATLLEPWDHDSANAYERLESTLQSIRRRAVVRVVPVPQGGGFWIDLAVFKELEDLPKPEQSSAGAATFRYDNTLTRVINPEHVIGATQGWILLGRDGALEQRILGQLQYRFSPMGQPVPLD